MLYREILRIAGLFFLGFSLVLLIPLFVAGYYEFIDTKLHHPQPHTTLEFFYTFLISASVGFIGWYLGPKKKGHLYRREWVAALVLIWLITPAMSALPFILSGTIDNPYQAYFEMVSGFTTTGATVLEGKKYDENGKEIPLRLVVHEVHDTLYEFYGTVSPVIDPHTNKVVSTGIEAVSKALLFWRSFTQWLGGMGVVLFFVALLPFLGVGGKTPRIKETTLRLVKTYVGLTILQIGALSWVDPKLEWLDKIATTFSTVSTGGFSVKNMSIAGYHHSGIEEVVLLFMFLSSVNFALYYFAFKGKVFKFKDPEFLLYISLLFIFGFVISHSLIDTEKMSLDGSRTGIYSVAESFRAGYFQLISAHSTTGFKTVNYDVWPYLPQALLLVAMYIGGMSGSPASGVKVIRLYVLYRLAIERVEALILPRNVRQFRVGGKEMEPKDMTLIFVFFTVVIGISLLATLFFVADGCDPETAFSVVASCLTNSGMGFRAASPLSSYAFLTNEGLAAASLIMILGRLEFFAFLAILIPSFWKQDN